jgi:hypothetical protein
MNDYSTDDVATFADRLSSMTEDELFTAMRGLEAQSETLSRDHGDTGDVLARIALVEDDIEDRYPGQALAPYKQWQRQGQ